MRDLDEVVKRCAEDRDRLARIIVELRARVANLEGAARHLIGCWANEVPQHTVYLAFENMQSVLNAAPAPKEGTDGR